MNSDEKDIQDVIDYALLSINQQEGSGKTHILSKVINVYKQVKKRNYYYFSIFIIKLSSNKIIGVHNLILFQIVSGFMYSIELEICESSHSKNDEKVKLKKSLLFHFYFPSN